MQVGFVGAQRGFDLLDLGAERLELRLGRLGARFGGLQAFLGGRVFGHQGLLPAQLDVRQRELRLALLQRRAQVAQLRARGVDACPIDRGVDLGKQLAFLHLAADLDVDLLELAGNLGADIDVITRLQRAGGGHEVFDIAALHGGELIGGEWIGPSDQLRPGQPGSGAGKAEHDEDEAGAQAAAWGSGF